MTVHLKPFALSALRSATNGGRRYHVWMGILTLFMLSGAYAYFLQLRDGLGVTGMNDHVSWGLYISNFTFLVGLAAAAMMLVLPAYILHDVDFGRAVLMAEAVAVASSMSPDRSLTSSTDVQKQVGQTMVQFVQARQRSATSLHRGLSALA